MEGDRKPTYKPVEPEIVQKYMISFYEKYNVDKELTAAKELIKVVQKTCSTLTVPTKEDLSKTSIFIVGKGGFGLNSYDSLSYSIKEIKDELTAVSYFSKLIFASENKQVSNYEFFELKERVMTIEKKINKLLNQSDLFRDLNK